MTKCESITPTSTQFVEVINKAIEENKLSHAKLLLLCFDDSFDDEKDLSGLPENVVVLKNIIRSLNKVGKVIFFSLLLNLDLNRMFRVLSRQRKDFGNC